MPTRPRVPAHASGNHSDLRGGANLGLVRIVRKARKTAELPRIYTRLAETVQFLSRVKVLTFSEAAAATYDTLRGLKLNVGKMDLRIAAIVLAERGTLVTRNRSDFGGIPGLVLEDWSS